MYYLQIRYRGRTEFSATSVMLDTDVIKQIFNDTLKRLAADIEKERPSGHTEVLQIEITTWA
jgi:hypothetical protein